MVPTRSFERYASEPPDPVQVDLDGADRFIVFMNVTAGSGAFDAADLSVRVEGADLAKGAVGWLVNDELRYSAEVAKGASLPLALSAEVIRRRFSETGERRVPFAVLVSRRLGSRPATKPVRIPVEAEVFLSKWPAGAASVAPFASRALALDDADKADSIVTLGRIDLHAPAALAMYGGPPARIRLQAELETPMKMLDASLRAMDIFPADENGAPSELVWCSGSREADFHIPKVTAAADPSVFGYEIGCAVSDLRELLYHSAEADSPILRAELKLHLKVAIVTDQDGAEAILHEGTTSLTVTGRMVERLRVALQDKEIEVDLAPGAHTEEVITAPPLLATIRHTRTESINDFPRQLPIEFRYEGYWDPSCLSVSIEAFLRSERGQFAAWSKEIGFTGDTQSIAVPLYRLLGAPAEGESAPPSSWSDASVLCLKMGARLWRPEADSGLERQFTIEVPIDIDDRMPGWVCCIAWPLFHTGRPSRGGTFGTEPRGCDEPNTVSRIESRNPPDWLWPAACAASSS